VRWVGETTGHLLVEHPEKVAYRDPWHLIAYATENASRFTESELFTLGALVLFMAIREIPPTGRGPGILDAADRGIDSFGPVHPAFDAGVISLKDRLFSVRFDDQPTLRAFDDQPTLRAVAFQLVRRDLETHGWCEPARPSEH